MPERLECEVLQKARYINTHTFTFYLLESEVLHKYTYLTYLYADVDSKLTVKMVG